MSTPCAVARDQALSTVIGFSAAAGIALGNEEEHRNGDTVKREAEHFDLSLGDDQRLRRAGRKMHHLPTVKLKLPFDLCVSVEVTRQMTL